MGDFSAKQNSKQDEVCYENWNTYGSSHFSFSLLDHCWNVVFWFFELRNLFTDEDQKIQPIHTYSYLPNNCVGSNNRRAAKGGKAAKTWSLAGF